MRICFCWRFKNSSQYHWSDLHVLFMFSSIVTYGHAVVYVINACVLINLFKYTSIDIDFSVWIDNREYNHMYIENKANSKRKLWQAIDEKSSLPYVGYEQQFSTVSLFIVVNKFHQSGTMLLFTVCDLIKGLVGCRALIGNLF